MDPRHYRAPPIIIVRGPDFSGVPDARRADHVTRLREHARRDATSASVQSACGLRGPGIRTTGPDPTIPFPSRRVPLEYRTRRPARPAALRGVPGTTAVGIVTSRGSVRRCRAAVERRCAPQATVSRTGASAVSYF